MKELSSPGVRMRPRRERVTETEPAAKDNPYRRSLLRRQRSVDTREAIVRAAARLWAERGYESTTVDEICTAAGIGRSTYYFHF